MPVTLIGLALLVSSMTRQPPEDEAVRLARAALIEKTGAQPNAVELHSVAAVDWPNTGLGCSEASGAFAQMIVSGYRVTLAVTDKLYEVHVGAGRAVVCGTPTRRASRQAPPAAEPRAKTKKSPIPMPEDAALRDLVLDAKTALAERLLIEAATITLVAVEEVVWPDGSLGCPVPGMLYPQVQQEGVRIELQAEDRIYEYHAGGRRKPFWCETPK